jgi:hypothetical protein
MFTLSILVSALVAVFTTLVVEYFAKPGLEARKERILAEKAALRELRHRLLVLIEHEREGTFPRSTFDQEAYEERDIARAGAEGDAIVESLVRCRDLLPQEVVRWLEFSLDGWKATIAPPLPLDDLYTDLQLKMLLTSRLLSAVNITSEYVALAPWRRRPRVAMVQEAKQRFDNRFQEERDLLEEEEPQPNEGD